MKDRRSFRFRALALSLLLAGSVGPLHAAEKTPSTAGPSDAITQAEQHLFLDKHFARTDQKTITYSYRQKGPELDAVDDTVRVDIDARHPDGTASVQVNFLSDKNRIAIAPVTHAEGNPALLGFLERDIALMKQLTGGSQVYFRKRIRLALADQQVQIKPVQVSLGKQKIDANKIVIEPYINDPMKERIGKYAGKTYVFVIGDQVPGGLYQAYTAESFAPGKAPVVDTVMTIASGDTRILPGTELDAVH